MPTIFIVSGFEQEVEGVHRVSRAIKGGVDVERIRKRPALLDVAFYETFLGVVGTAPEMKNGCGPRAGPARSTATHGVRGSSIDKFNPYVADITVASHCKFKE